MQRNSRASRPAVEEMESRQLLTVAVIDANQAIATGLYRQVLRRDPDPQGLARLERQLDAGASVRQAAGVLIASPEFRRGEVASYYEEMLDRAPTPEELRRWTGVLIAGAGEDRVVGAIAGTTEYYARSGGDDASFVRSLYVDLLGRRAEAGELATYVSRLQVGATTPSRLASEFTGKAEFRQEKVREVYQVALDRAPTGRELAGWAASWRARGGLKGVALGVLGGVENAARLRQGTVARPDTLSADQLRRILQAPYSEASTGFVNLFNALLRTRPTYDADGNPVATTPGNVALWELLKAGGATDGRPRDERQDVAPIVANVAALLPLQSEIDIDKSLGFVLGQDPAKSDLEDYLTGGTLTPFGGPIITGGGGAYIVDGHHRWSSIYVVNPYAQIAAVDLGHERAPQEYLKITQAAIGANLGFLPVQSVEGQNLFTITREAFDAWVATTIANGKNPDAVLEVFRNTKGVDGIPAVAAYLWANVERMREQNRPVPGVTSRDYMPQPPNGDLQPILHLLESGLLNFRLPALARLG
jgi:hypothetical protein